MSDAPPTTDEMPEPRPTAGWRKLLWSTCAVLAIAPVTALATFITILLVRQNGRLPIPAPYEDAMMLGLPVLVALLSSYPPVRGGLRRDWPAGNRAIWFGAIAAGLSLALVAYTANAFRRVRDSSRFKAMIPGQLAAAANQYFLEYGDAKILIPYSDLVGTTRYVRAYNAVDGEDPSAQFPIYNGWGQVFDVRLPDGSIVQRQDYFASVSRGGLVATYPPPQSDTGGHVTNRVYQLPNGVRFRGMRAVDLPPDPATREGRDQDGVHIYLLEGVKRYEITFRGGLADGPFRAYDKTGRLIVEATYVRGHINGPAWHHLPDGRKFDELAVTIEQAIELQTSPAKQRL